MDCTFFVRTENQFLPPFHFLLTEISDAALWLFTERYAQLTGALYIVDQRLQVMQNMLVCVQVFALPFHRGERMLLNDEHLQTWVFECVNTRHNQRKWGACHCDFCGLMPAAFSVPLRHRFINADCISLFLICFEDLVEITCTCICDANGDATKVTHVCNRSEEAREVVFFLQILFTTFWLSTTTWASAQLPVHRLGKF
jgi:hypothetical protein